MRVSRMAAIVAAGIIMVPIALALGLVMMVAAFDDEAEGSPMPLVPDEGLRIGKGGVPAEYAPLIVAAAESCKSDRLPAPVLAAQLKQESGFNPNAQSPVGAQGIAQFMPGTWQTWGTDGNGDGKKDVLDPEDAIPAQGKFMCSLLRQAMEHPEYRGSPIELALAGYNAGFGAVQKYKGVPPYKETQHYVEVILEMSKQMAVPVDGGDSGEWTAPVRGVASTPYGQKGPMWQSGYHTGVDFVVPVGTKLKAVGPGIVVAVGAGGAYGNQVVIRHPDGMYSQYAHLSKLSVKNGQKVKGGTQIGLSGATGNVTGPHLHFEIRTRPAYGSDISPLPYLRKHGVRI